MKSQSLLSPSAAVAAQTFETNKVIPISMAGGYFDPDGPGCVQFMGVCIYPEGEHRVHYCGLDLKEYCTDDVNPEKTGCTTDLNDWISLCQVGSINGKDFGLSHATITNVAANGRERWPHIAWSATSNEAAQISYLSVNQHKEAIPVPQNMSKIVPSAYWNWRADIYAQYNCSDPQSGGTYAICGSEIGKVRQNTPIFYNLSSNMAGADDNYLNGNSINPQYFKNYSTRADLGTTEYNTVGKWGMATRLDMEPASVKYRKGVLSMEDLKNSYKNFINQLTWESSAPNIIVPLSAVAFQELSFAKYNTGGYVKEIANDYSLTASSITALPSTRQIIEGDREGVTYSISM